MKRRVKKGLFLIAYAIWCTPSLLVAGEIPVALLSVPENAYTVLIDKSLQRLEVDKGRALVNIFACSTGRTPGDKEVQGDNRTPEGIYFFDDVKDNGHLPRYYGWRAYILDYPNPVDKIFSKDGDGIWIHGRMNSLSPMDTHGCIALTNNNLKKLSRYLYREWTPIVVLDRITLLDEKVLRERADQYRNFIMSWLNAWENKDLNKFRKCYSRRFREAKGHNLDAYIRHKQRLFRVYDSISIDTDGLRIIFAKKYALALFLEDFSGDHFHNSGVKFVYVAQENGIPKIVAERFVGVDRASKWMSRESALEARLRRELYGFIDKWKDAWMKKDIERMKSYYLDSFPEKDVFFEKKARHLSLYKDIDISLEGINISRSGVFWDVVAKQRFETDRYKDFGIKQLRIIRKGHRFYIQDETWEKL